MGPAQRPLHLLFFDESSADHLIDRRLHEWRAIIIVSACRRRSPKFGMNSRLLEMYVLRGCLKSPGRSRLTVRGPGFAPAVWKLEWETYSVKYDRIGTFQTPSQSE